MFFVVLCDFSALSALPYGRLPGCVSDLVIHHCLPVVLATVLYQVLTLKLFALRTCVHMACVILTVSQTPAYSMKKPNLSNN